MPIDIIVAPANQFDAILKDVNNESPLDTQSDAEVSIDDVVTIVALYRNAIDDRTAWWKIRREVNSRFSSHAEISARSLALIPDPYRDELAGFSEADITSVATRWSEHQGSSPKSLEQAKDSLAALVSACQKAKAQGNGVLLRTNQPANVFEVAFSKLSGKELAKYKKAFERLDNSQKFEAHQKFNYYENEGVGNSLALVLRDLTRRGTKKVNLKTDQKAIHKHIKECVKKYSKKPCPIAGDPDSPITLIMLSFDIEYEGYIDFTFDTRLDAISKIRIEEQTEDCLEMSHWNEVVERLGEEEESLSITLHDGSKVSISPDEGDAAFEAYVGKMLRDTLVEARDAGVFAKLPLANPCYMAVGGTHADYAWPADFEFGPECQANV